MSDCMGEKTKLIVDDTTIYEIDIECFSCLSNEERSRYYDSELKRVIEQDERMRDTFMQR